MPRPPAPAARPAAPPAREPLYRIVKAEVTRALRQGLWAPGQAIPSEAELAQRYHVSPGTVRKAIAELAAEHLLVRHQGRGTFVATHAEAGVQYRFLRLTPDQGLVQPLQRRMLSCTRERASAEVARALELRSGDLVIRVQRLLLADDRPVVYDDLWLPGVAFRALDLPRLQQHQGTMYRLFETSFGIRMIRAEEQIRAVAADAERAQALAVPQGAPLLWVQRRAFTYDDRPMEWRHGWYETSAHHYRHALN
ncbi:MAG: GntR family transcriptional regulator [Aquabacterium sp.]